MIRIKKSNVNIYYDQGENFTIHTLEVYETTKLNKRNNLWYYEGTCYSGNGYGLFGFTTNIGRVAFYPYNDIKKPLIVLQGDIRTNTIQEQQTITVPFPIEFPYTVGIGINPKDFTFTVFYKDHFYTVDINKEKDITSISPYIWGSISELTDETVSINFGYFPFTYSVYGLNPWENFLETNFLTINKIQTKFDFYLYILVLL